MNTVLARAENTPVAYHVVCSGAARGEVEKKVRDRLPVGFTILLEKAIYSRLA